MVGGSKQLQLTSVRDIRTKYFFPIFWLKIGLGCNSDNLRGLLIEKIACKNESVQTANKDFGNHSDKLLFEYEFLSKSKIEAELHHTNNLERYLELSEKRVNKF